MNEFDDIDRELTAAFTQRPSTLSRPSLRDVKQRARRHQRQRQAGVLSACALVGVGGVAVIAQRSPSNETTVGGLEGDPTTTMCFPATTTAVTWPATDSTLPTYHPNSVKYVVESGDNPTMVAERFGVTLQELNDANVDNPQYELFLSGTEILIPASPLATTTTNPAYNVVAGTTGTYTLAEGDFPGSVAEMFGVTVAELDAANRDVPGYGGFIVGTEILIPLRGYELTPTTTTGVAQLTEIDCYSQTPWVGYWRCSGAVGVEGPYSYFDVCEPVSNQNTEPTVVVPTTLGFLKIGTAVQVANCSNQEGVARNMSNQLAAEGFTTAEPDTCTIDLPVTKVIYNPDDPNGLAVAHSVAILLGDAVVEPSGPSVPTLTLGTWAAGSSVLVLLGDDLAGKTLAQIAGQANISPTTTYELTADTTG